MFKKFSKPKLSVDEILYKEAKNTIQALGNDKERKLLQDELSENIGKPKEIGKIIKKIDLPDKKATTTSIYLNTKKQVTFSPRTITNTFKKYFVNLASDLDLKSFLLTLQENLEYLQYASMTKELTSVKKKLIRKS